MYYIYIYIYLIFAIIYCTEVPQDINDLLEGCTRLRKASILIVMVYYSEMIQIKFSKIKGHIEWSIEETREKLPVLLL